LFKDVYGPTIENLLPDAVPLLKRIAKAEAAMFDGRNVIYPSRMGRNRGVMATAERGRHPAAGAGRPVLVRIPVRFVHGQVEVTAQAMELSRTNAGAFARILKDEMAGLVDSLDLQLSYYVWGDGRGVRALVDTDPGTGLTVTVDSPGGVAGTVNGARFINPGDYIVFLDPTTGGLRAGGTRLVDVIGSTGATFTVTSAVDAAVADNDFIVKAWGSDASIIIEDTEWQHPPMGMLGAVDNGTYVQNYHGISRASEPLWNSTIVTSVGALSSDVVYRGLDVVSQLGGKTSELWMEESVRRAFVALTDAGRRYQGADLNKPDAGADIQSRQTFGTLPIYTDKFAPYGMIFGLDFRHFERYEPVPGKWVDNDGRIVRKVSGYDQFEATYRKYCNFHCRQPNKQVRWEGVTATALVVHIF
jgi:hypothetical protein